MLRWDQWHYDIWRGYSGEALVVQIERHGDIFEWSCLPARSTGAEASLEKAKELAETAFSAWLQRAGLPSGDYQDGYRAGLEAAARLVDETSEAYAGSRKYLAPRIDGSLTGLGYAEAIRKLAAAPKPGEAP